VTTRDLLAILSVRRGREKGPNGSSRSDRIFRRTGPHGTAEPFLFIEIMFTKLFPLIMNAYAPNGKRIVGTADTIPGTAKIAPDSFTEDGDFDHTGNTDVHWNGQQTEMDDGEPLFVDEEGVVWKKSELTIE
jgi:hypothetical protein